MIGRLFSKLWRIINLLRVVILNLFFFGLLFAFFMTLSSDKDEISIPENAALVLNIQGRIVEQKEQVNPMDAFVAEAMDQQEENPEVLISDILYVINTAKNDHKIKLLVLNLNKMQNSGLSKLQDIGHALSAFKASGKEIIAVGDQYSQEQYYLASYANQVWLNPKGWLLFEGYSSYQMYFKTALEKLAINQHVFRVGTYKSAVEPFIRDDMSPEAKEANLLWLNDLWQQYKEDVAKQRSIDIANFDENIDVLLTKVAAANGNIAEYALQNNWVDALKTRELIRLTLIDKVGKNAQDNFTQINFKDYLKVTKPVIAFDNPNKDKVAIIVAKGNILDGVQKPGTIGGTSTAELLRKARQDNTIKAVVLRVDSPGGSAYASEVIRQEVEQLKAAGKPVVASMGTYAASGGYWISASADKIVASPSTITGSIGIFGLMMTFEESLAKLGIYTDGVATTELGGFGVTRPLNEKVGKLIQLHIERGYQDFIELVAKNRKMTVEAVDIIAQGRVWSGIKAKELGLVDELGNLDDAINIAASLAGLEQFDIKLVEKELSPMDIFLHNAFGQASALVFVNKETTTLGPVEQLMKQLSREVKQFNHFNDPHGAYSFCLTCEIN